MKLWPSIILSGAALLLACGFNLPNPAQKNPAAQKSLTAPETSVTAPTSGMVMVVYSPTSADVPNPERGFYHMEETFASAHTPLDLTTLQDYREQEHITLVLREFYLDSFRTSPISANYLTAIQTDFNTARQAGVKLIVRFAYNQTAVSPNPDDPTLAQMLAHLDQLQPILHANSDVLAVLQAGLIGAWGEWYYTTNEFGTPPDLPNYANRRTLVQKILATLPVTRMVQLRTPDYKQKIFTTTNGASGALSETLAYGGSDLARVGHHNDCFLADETDMGTYTDLEQDYAYLAAETRFLPMGGETCQVNPPRSAWDTAAQELALFHWSYLNRDYHVDVLNSWGANLTATAQLKLGYRLVLQTGRFSQAAFPGGTLSMTLALKNEGWAAPYNPRWVELVLRHTTTSALYPFPLPVDPRRWLPNGSTYTISQAFTLPAELPLGNYELLLHLPDPTPTLHAQPAYAIQLANSNVWEAVTGYNTLHHTLTVSTSIPNTGLHFFLPLVQR